MAFGLALSGEPSKYLGMPEVFFALCLLRLHFHIFGTAGGVEHGALLSSLSPNIRGRAAEQPGDVIIAVPTRKRKVAMRQNCKSMYCRIHVDQLWYILGQEFIFGHYPPIHRLVHLDEETLQ